MLYFKKNYKNFSEREKMFFDTHCHLDMMAKKRLQEKSQQKVKNDFLENLDAVSLIVGEASSEGVEGIVTVGTTAENSEEAVLFAKELPFVFATVGIHPCDIENFSKNFKTIEKILEKNRPDEEGNAVIVGIGETGLDFYHKPYVKQKQIDAFTAHIEVAIKNNLPLIVHIRESAEEVLKVLEPYKKEVFGVAHCFFQKEDIANILIDWGFYLGIGGPISYPKNDWLRDLFTQIPLKNVLLETDAPFLPPQQYRGKENHPKYLSLIAQEIARVKNITVEEVGKITTENAKKLFKI